MSDTTQLGREPETNDLTPTAAGSTTTRDRSLQRIMDYMRDSLEKNPLEAGLRSTHAMMMQVSVAMGGKLVNALAAQEKLSLERLDKARLAMNSYNALNRQIEKLAPENENE